MSGAFVVVGFVSASGVPRLVYIMITLTAISPTLQPHLEKHDVTVRLFGDFKLISNRGV